jgi:hypothetical protein
VGNLGTIVYFTVYTIFAPTTTWTNPAPPGRGPEVIDGGTAAQLSAAKHLWDGDVNTSRMYCTVEKALKKQIITIFESMFLEILNEDMVEFVNILARDMFDHLFLSYRSISDVGL